MIIRKMLCLILFVVILMGLPIFHHALGYTVDYEYDDQYRLTKVTRSNGTTIVYNYDEAGNRTQMIVNSSAAAPVAAFTASPVTGNAPLTVNFTDQSTGNITSWSWNFGDGLTSTEQNPSHIYQNEGVYSVSLTATGPSGSNTETKANLITVSAGLCTYSLSPSTQSVTSSGGSFSVVTNPSLPSCSPSISADVQWITINGYDAGTVSYTVAANTDSSARTGHISIAGQLLTVTQDGEQYQLLVTVTGSGTVTSAPSGISCMNGSGVCGMMFASGSQVTLTPVASAGYVFSNWSGACAGTGTCVVTMNAAQTVTAVFSLLQTFTVTAAVGPSGGGSITPANTVVNSGASVTLSIVPNSGFTLSALTDNGAQVSAVPGPSGNFTYTISSVAANHEVIATFAESSNWAQFIIQPGPEGKDTYYGTAYGQNGGPDSSLLNYGGWSDYYYNYIEFDLANAPAANIVTTAKLYLFSNATPTNDPALTVNRITQSWTETGVTISSNPTSTYYTTMGRIVGGWNVVDITSLYKDWKNGVYSNYGVKLSPTYNNATNASFYSSDYTDNPALRPMLVIETNVPGNYAYRSLDAPGAAGWGTVAYGISGSKIVGAYSNDGTRNYCFIYDGTNYTTLEVPGTGASSFGAYAMGVDGSKVVGYYADGSGISRGFVYDGLAYTPIDVPGANGAGTMAYGISGSNIVGIYSYEGHYHGFVYDGANYSTIDVPGSTLGTQAYDIDGSKIVGSYNDSAGMRHGFVYEGGTYTTLDVPGAVSGTYLSGINGSSMVGSYSDGSRYRGFVYNGSTYTIIDVPGSDYTFAYGIDGNNIVGQYMLMIGGNATFHGFVATPLAAPVSGDFTGDSDVDGSDLVALIANPSLLDIATFAANFGRTGSQ